VELGHETLGRIIEVEVDELAQTLDLPVRLLQAGRFGPRHTGRVGGRSARTYECHDRR
jgi:hypothetical protein